MGTIANYLKNARLNWLKGTAYPAAPASVFLDLLTTFPTDDAGTGEAVANYTGYAQQSIANTAWSAIQAGGGTAANLIDNVNQVAFPVNTGASQTVVGIRVKDAAAGNTLGWAAITSTAIATNQDLRINAGSFDWSED